MVRPDSKRGMGLKTALDLEAGIHNGVDYDQFKRMASFQEDGKRRSSISSIARTMGVHYMTAQKYVQIFDMEQERQL